MTKAFAFEAAARWRPHTTLFLRHYSNTINEYDDDDHLAKRKVNLLSLVLKLLGLAHVLMRTEVLVFNIATIKDLP